MPTHPRMIVRVPNQHCSAKSSISYTEANATLSPRVQQRQPTGVIYISDWCKHLHTVHYLYLTFSMRRVVVAAADVTKCYVRPGQLLQDDGASRVRVIFSRSRDAAPRVTYIIMVYFRKKTVCGNSST